MFSTRTPGNMAAGLAAQRARLIANSSRSRCSSSSRQQRLVPVIQACLSNPGAQQQQLRRRSRSPRQHAAVPACLPRAGVATAARPPQPAASSGSAGDGPAPYALQRELWPPELVCQQPPRGDAVTLDVTHLVSVYEQQDPDEAQGAADAADAMQQGDPRWQQEQQQQQRQRLLLLPQQMMEQQRRLLWVSVNQPGGPRTPAAIWVADWSCQIAPDQLQLQPGAPWRVLLQLPGRPDLGQAPAAVTVGNRFLLATSCSLPWQPASSSTGPDGSSTPEAAPGWRDFLLLYVGDFSPSEHENMFPNAFCHCADGRTLFDARGAHDVGALVAEAEAAAVSAHCDNLLRFAWQQRDSAGSGGSPLPWVYKRLQQRWGLVALLHFGVGSDYLTRAMARVLPQVAATAQPRADQGSDSGQDVLPASG